MRSRHVGDSNYLADAITAQRGEGGTRPQILAYHGTDYPFRIVITKNEWAAWLAVQALDIDYSNFKDRVTRTQGGPRHDVYSRVWSALLGLEKLAGAMTGRDKLIDATPERPSAARRRALDAAYFDRPRPSTLADLAPWMSDDPDAPDDDLTECADCGDWAPEAEMDPDSDFCADCADWARRTGFPLGKRTRPTVDVQVTGDQL